MPENGDFVVPGTELGYTEEFIPGDGAFEENGVIYAALTGQLKKDMKERKIAVLPKVEVPPVPKNGDIVLGSIADVKAQVAIVNIIKLLGKDRAMPGEVTGTVHISQTKDSYVQYLDREFKTGDIIFAKITNASRMPLQLSTVDKNLGVVKAFCFNCNTALAHYGGKLKCPTCGRMEYRKLSSEYGKGQV